MLTSITILVIVGIFWTMTGVVMGGVARKGISVEPMQFVSYLLGTAVCLALLPLYPPIEAKGGFAAFALGMYFLVGVLNYFVNITMAAAMKRGPNSLVWAILQAGMIIPFIYGICFHDVHAGPLRLLGMVSMLMALWLISMDRGSAETASGRTWLLLSFVAFLIVGVQQTVNTEPSYYPETRSGIPIIYRCLALSLGNLVATLPSTLRISLKGGIKALGGKWLWLFAITLQASILLEKLFLSFRAMDMMAKLGNGALSYPIMVISCIAVFTLYSIIVLHEKVTWRSTGGLVLCTMGIVLLSL
ncbi:MAG: hypothetical protein J5833_07325 [Victivallales bacterium]|nr:hypothetical protein [Victivallales bacterium]